MANLKRKYTMTSISTYRNKVYSTVIIENVSINTIRDKYLSLTSNYLAPVFDRNFKENKEHFNLPYSFDIIKVDIITK